MPHIYAQNYTYAEAIIRAGGVPVLLPLTSNEAVTRALYEHCSAIVFAGGEDIDPARYGQKPVPETTSLSPLRDDFEWLLMQWALEDDKPVLGICRGMQILNMIRGGSLHLHALRDLPGVQDHYESRNRKDASFIAHTLKIDPTSKLAHILGYDTMPTNTRHHQAVKDVGEGLLATAWAEDGVIEALELPEKTFVLGIESHPEDLFAEVEPRWISLFEAFVDAAELYSQAGDEQAVVAA